MEMEFKNKINSRVIIIGGVVLALIIVGLGFWYWKIKKNVPISNVNAPVASTSAVPVTEQAGRNIGAQIFEKTHNPLTNKLPETNPLKNIIKNPF